MNTQTDTAAPFWQNVSPKIRYVVFAVIPIPTGDEDIICVLKSVGPDRLSTTYSDEPGLAAGLLAGPNNGRDSIGRCGQVFSCGSRLTSGALVEACPERVGLETKSACQDEQAFP
jgi:hypothetical protein